MLGLYRKPSFWMALTFLLAGLAGVAMMLIYVPSSLGWVLLIYLMFAALVLIQFLFDTEKSKKRTTGSTYRFRVVRRSLLFAAMFVLSVPGFPILGAIGAYTGLDWLLIALAWPFCTLFPLGLGLVGGGLESAILVNTALFGAIACWLLLSVLYGYIARKISLRSAALAAYPAMVLIALLANLILYFSGYTAKVPYI
jgi:hypothetical protein